MATTTTGPSPSPSSSAPPATNPRGIPSFPFMTSVTEYVSTLSDVEPTLRRFSEMISKYSFMQSNVETRAAGLREKLPEMRNSLDTIRFLIKRREETPPAVQDLALEEAEEEEDDDDEGKDGAAERGKKSGLLSTTFSLSPTLFAHATINPSALDSVYLWLGANVMVAYPIAEAEELLASKLEKATESLRCAEEDLEFLRVQITTLEVATARVYNWDVGEKRRLKGKGEGDGE